MTTPQPISTNAPLTVKELAYELGVSEHYVYQMRACGFPMVWRKFKGSDVEYLTATVESAREWIERNNFHLSHSGGRGVINGQLKFRLQTELLNDFGMMVNSFNRNFYERSAQPTREDEGIVTMSVLRT